jgi:hypothetical protein
MLKAPAYVSPAVLPARFQSRSRAIPRFIPAADR